MVLHALKRNKTKTMTKTVTKTTHTMTRIRNVCHRVVKDWENIQLQLLLQTFAHPTAVTFLLLRPSFPKRILEGNVKQNVKIPKCNLKSNWGILSNIQAW